MNVRALAVALAVSLAACGGKGSPTVVGNHASASASEPEAVVAAFAEALRRDDGAALAALVDPEHGLTLWYTPGAGYARFDTIAAGDTTAPSKHVHEGVEDSAERWASYPWKDVVRSITDGLAKLDRDPADPDAPIYGDCGNEEAPVRAYLVHGQNDRDLRSMDLGDDGEVTDAEAIGDLAVFNHWGLRAYLRSTPSGWRLTHLTLQEVCSA